MKVSIEEREGFKRLCIRAKGGNEQFGKIMNQDISRNRSYSGRKWVN